MSVFGITMRLDGGFTVVRFSSQTWYSDPSDSIGVQEWIGRISAGSDPTFGVRVGCVVWGTDTVSSFGSVELVNTDDELSWLMGVSAQDAECEIFLVADGETWDTRTVLARCLVDRFERDEDSIQVFLKSKAARLEAALQPQTFPDTTPNEQLRGAPFPLMIGRVFQAEPALVDPTQSSPPALIYQAHDTDVIQIDQVWSGGSEMFGPFESPPQWDYASRGFVTYIDPAARVTINAYGACIISPDQLGGSGQFFAPAEWPISAQWTVTATGSATVTESSGIGATFFAPIGELGNPEIISDNPPVNGTWYLVQVKVARLLSGSWLLDMGGEEVVIDREGESFYVLQASAPVRIRNGTGAQLDGTIAYVYAYPFDLGNLTPGVTQMLYHALLRGGFTEHEIDVTQWTAHPVLSTSLTYECGYYTRQSATAMQLIREAMASVTGWMYVALDGTVRAGTILDPDTQTATLTVDRVNLVTYPRFSPDFAPGLSDTWAARRNWSPYQESELAGITYTDQQPFMADYRDKRRIMVSTGDGDFGFPFARPYRRAVGAPPVRTLLTEGDDAQAEGQRVCDLYLKERGFWTFSVAFSDPSAAASVQPGDIVQMDPDLFGFTTGAGKGIVVEVQGSFRRNVVQLTVWTSST